jgi:hypothetical protein
MSIITVGSTGQFQTIHDAVAAASSGDTINVAAGTYNNDFLSIQKSLVLQAVDGQVVMTETTQPPNGKAMITEGAAGISVSINGFTVSGVSVPDGNGAAVRYEGGNLSLTNDLFMNNQEGLLGNGDDPNGTISVHHSEFSFNGDGSGFTHNFYAGAIASVSIDQSYFHDANVGHEIKSRAANTTVTNSRVFDNNATASYSIDTPNGGNVNISNDVIEQGPNSENQNIFAWGEEGASQGGSETIANNTIVNDRTGGVGVLSSAPVSFTGNQVWNLGNLGNVNASGTVNLAARPSLDTSAMAFINPASDASGGGTGSGTGDSGGVTGGGGGTPPLPPPPTLTIDDYHAMVLSDFLAYFMAHPSVLSNIPAVTAFIGEYTSPTVLAAPLPGDLWSHA